jgi:hypothetical protein
MGTAWERHGMCESAFNLLEPSGPVKACNGIALALLYSFLLEAESTPVKARVIDIMYMAQL